MKTYVSVTISAEINDETAFRQTAYQQALKDGQDDSNAREYLDAESKSLGECAAMVLDPGLSPNGCTLLGSDWDENEG